MKKSEIIEKIAYIILELFTQKIFFLDREDLKKIIFDLVKSFSKMGLTNLLKEFEFLDNDFGRLILNFVVEKDNEIRVGVLKYRSLDIEFLSDYLGDFAVISNNNLEYIGSTGIIKKNLSLNFKIKKDMIWLSKKIYNIETVDLFYFGVKKSSDYRILFRPNFMKEYIFQKMLINFGIKAIYNQF